MTTDDTTTLPDANPPGEMATQREEPRRSQDLSSTMELGDDDLEDSASAADAHTTPRPFIPAETAPVHEAPKRPARLALLLVSLALLATILVGGGAYWLTSGRSGGDLFGRASNEVLILVVTRPKSARLFVDGVLQKTKSLQLQRSRGHVQLRAEAPGYRPKTITLALAHTRVLHLSLTPKTSGRAARTGLRPSIPDQTAPSSSTGSASSGPRLLKPRPSSRPSQAIDTEKAPIE
ncbi:MAG: hypothetical protein KAI47_16365 [Deltaproteobacteria bacterium]|nr:hypothetical protein [Deltaproteobacteria bacterium]